MPVSLDKVNWRDANSPPIFRKSGLYKKEITTLDLKKMVVEHYSEGKNCCECCGENMIEFLTVHHVDGGGKVHRKNTPGGPSFYRMLIIQNFPMSPRLSIICYNCNNAIKIYGKCPHKRVSDSQVDSQKIDSKVDSPLNLNR